jgi:hypothetical protein
MLIHLEIKQNSMATFVNQGDSIEGGKSHIHVRKVTNPILIDIDGIGRFFKYKSKIRAIITITEELIPKIHRICCDSKLDLNDELDAATIDILTSKRIKTWKLISNFSNVHGIQSNIVNDFTYAKILIPWRFVLERGLSGNKNTLPN